MQHIVTLIDSMDSRLQRCFDIAASHLMRKCGLTKRFLYGSLLIGKLFSWVAVSALWYTTSGSVLVLGFIAFVLLSAIRTIHEVWSSDADERNARRPPLPVDDLSSAPYEKGMGVIMLAGSISILLRLSSGKEDLRLAITGAASIALLGFCSLFLGYLARTPPETPTSPTP